MNVTWHILWKCAVIVLLGVWMLRLSGRRSISQMTAGTTVIMISIGNIMAHGVVEDLVWRAIITVALFLLLLVVLEYLELKFKLVERIFSGKAVVVIRDGKVDEGQLRKLRMTKNQLEMRLRQQGISNAEDLLHATIEVNGMIGYEFKRHARPVTIGDLERMFERKGEASDEDLPDKRS